MVFLFRDKSLINIILLIFLSIGIHAHWLWSPVVVAESPSSGWLSEWMAGYLTKLHPTILFLLFQGLLISLALRLNGIMDRMRMFPSSTYLPALTLVLLSGLFPIWCYLSPALVSGHLLLWIFSRIADLPQQAQSRSALMNNGLILGIAVIAYHPMLWMAIASIPAMATVKRFRINEYLIYLLGFLLPYYFLLAGSFLMDNLPAFFRELPTFSPSWPMARPDEMGIASLVLLVIALLTGLSYWQRFNSRLLMQTRNCWSVLLIFLLFLLPLPFLMSRQGMEGLWLMTLPLSAFFSTAFSVPRRLLLPNILFWLLVAQSVVHNWFILKK